MIVASADRPPRSDATDQHAHTSFEGTADIAVQLREIVRFGAAAWGALLLHEPHAVPILSGEGDLPNDLAHLLADPVPACVTLNAGTAGPIHRILLAVRGAPLGTLLIGFAHADPPDERRQALLALLANGLAQRLHAARLQRRIERLTSQLAMINHLGQHTSWIHDQQLLLEQIARLIYKTLGHDHIQLLLIDETRGTVDAGVIGAAAAIGRPAVTTVGRIQADPNYPAIVPGKVTFTIDARHPEPRPLAELYARHEALMRAVATRRGLDISWYTTLDLPPCPSDPDTVALLQAAARDLGVPTMLMHSGAGHDSQVMAGRSNIAMIFVQSKDGRSHTPAEFTSNEHAVLGINLLAAGLYRLAYE